MTIIKHNLTDKERGQNRAALIKHLKDRKKQVQQEIEADVMDPFFLSKLEELRMRKKLTSSL